MNCQVAHEDRVADVEVVVLLEDGRVAVAEQTGIDALLSGRNGDALAGAGGGGAVTHPAVLRTGPTGDGADRRGTVAEPELQLVVGASDVEEFRPVNTRLARRAGLRCNS